MVLHTFDVHQIHSCSFGFSDFRDAWLGQNLHRCVAIDMEVLDSLLGDSWST